MIISYIFNTEIPNHFNWLGISVFYMALTSFRYFP